MKKNLITAATTIITSAMIFLSASPVTAFANQPVTAIQPKSVAVTTTVTQKTSITKNQALQIALDHAGYTSKDILYSEVKKEFDDGVEVYEVEFRVGFCEYNYDIAVADGQILEYEIDD